MDIGAYLSVIREKINKKYAYKDIVVETILETTGVTLSRDAVKYKNEILFITAPSIVKSELLLRKEKLLTILQTKGLTYKDIK